MNGFLFPTLSLIVPITNVVRVAVMALTATIQAMGFGSGVMVSKTNVLNQEFSTFQAICPARPSKTMTNQFFLPISDLLMCAYVNSPRERLCSFHQIPQSSDQ